MEKISVPDLLTASDPFAHVLLAGAILFGIVVGLAVALIGAIPVWLIWNWLFAGVETFGYQGGAILGVTLPEITFWQAFWLNVLCSWLFGKTFYNSGNSKKK